MIISVIVAIVGLRSACMVFFSVKEIVSTRAGIWVFFVSCDCVIVAACAKYLFKGGL